MLSLFKQISSQLQSLPLRLKIYNHWLDLITWCRPFSTRWKPYWCEQKLTPVFLIPQFYSNYCIGGFPSSSVLWFPPPSCYFVAGVFGDALWVASCLETGCKIHLVLKSAGVFFQAPPFNREPEIRLCERLPRTVSHGSVHSVYPSPVMSMWARGAASDPHKVTPRITVPLQGRLGCLHPWIKNFTREREFWAGGWSQCFLWLQSNATALRM